LGQGLFGENLPLTHRSFDTAHALWLQTHCQMSVVSMGDVITHNSGKDRRSIFELGGWVDHMTRCAWPLTRDRLPKVRVSWW